MRRFPAAGGAFAATQIANRSGGAALSEYSTISSMRVFAHGLLAVFLSLISISPAWAQQGQTKESAQEFFRVTFPGVALATLPYDMTVSVGGVLNNRSKVAASASPAGYEDCITHLTINFEYDLIWSAGKIEHKYGQVVRMIDWREPFTITRNGQYVNHVGRYYTYGFLYPSEALATRAAFAMEFMRTSCDPTNSLAF